MFWGPMQRTMICWNRSPLPPLVAYWGKFSSGGSPFESECSLAAAALNTGKLKHGKVVDINRLHVSLVHAHASVLQATVRQYGFRLTRELVFVFSMFEGQGEPGAKLPTTRWRALRDRWSWYISTPRILSRHLSGDRGTSLCCWTTPLTSSVATAPATSLRLPSSPS